MCEGETHLTFFEWSSLPEYAVYNSITPWPTILQYKNPSTLIS